MKKVKIILALVFVGCVKCLPTKDDGNKQWKLQNGAGILEDTAVSAINNLATNIDNLKEESEENNGDEDSKEALSAINLNPGLKIENRAQNQNQHSIFISKSQLKNFPEDRNIPIIKRQRSINSQINNARLNEKPEITERSGLKYSPPNIKDVSHPETIFQMEESTEQENQPFILSILSTVLNIHPNEPSKEDIPKNFEPNMAKQNSKYLPPKQEQFQPDMVQLPASNIKGLQYLPTKVQQDVVHKPQHHQDVLQIKQNLLNTQQPQSNLPPLKQHPLQHSNLPPQSSLEPPKQPYLQQDVVHKQKLLNSQQSQLNLELHKEPLLQQYMARTQYLNLQKPPQNMDYLTTSDLANYPLGHQPLPFPIHTRPYLLPTFHINPLGAEFKPSHLPSESLPTEDDVPDLPYLPISFDNPFDPDLEPIYITVNKLKKRLPERMFGTRFKPVEIDDTVYVNHESPVGSKGFTFPTKNGKRVFGYTRSARFLGHFLNN